MGRQDEKWRDEEKAWLVEQYETPAVQHLFQEQEGHFLNNATKHVYAQYQIAWSEPLGLEPEAKYRARLANARGAQRKDIVRKPAETAEQAKARVEGREPEIYAWLRDRRARHKKALTVPVAIPHLPKAARTRTPGALDIYLRSSMGHEQVPVTMTADNRPAIGQRRALGREMLNTLDSEQNADLQLAVQQEKEASLAEQIEEAGSEAEWERAGRVPSLRPYMERVQRHIERCVNWDSYTIMAGPGVDGKLAIIPVTQACDRQGRDFLTALGAHFCLSPDEMKAFTVAFFLQTSHVEAAALGTPAATVAVEAHAQATSSDLGASEWGGTSIALTKPPTIAETLALTSSAAEAISPVIRAPDTRSSSPAPNTSAIVEDPLQHIWESSSPASHIHPSDLSHNRQPQTDNDVFGYNDPDRTLVDDHAEFEVAPLATQARLPRAHTPPESELVSGSMGKHAISTGSSVSQDRAEVVALAPPAPLPQVALFSAAEDPPLGESHDVHENLDTLGAALPPPAWTLSREPSTPSAFLDMGPVPWSPLALGDTHTPDESRSADSLPEGMNIPESSQPQATATVPFDVGNVVTHPGIEPRSTRRSRATRHPTPPPTQPLPRVRSRTRSKRELGLTGAEPITELTTRKKRAADTIAIGSRPAKRARKENQPANPVPRARKSGSLTIKLPARPSRASARHTSRKRH